MTSLSPALLGRWGTNFKVLVTLLPLAIGLALLTHAGVVYVGSGIVLLRLYQSVPYWLYRDVVPMFPASADPNDSVQARGAGA